jgi:hypothetical protein
MSTPLTYTEVHPDVKAAALEYRRVLCNQNCLYDIVIGGVGTSTAMSKNLSLEQWVAIWGAANAKRLKVDV